MTFQQQARRWVLAWEICGWTLIEAVAGSVRWPRGAEIAAEELAKRHAELEGYQE